MYYRRSNLIHTADKKYQPGFDHGPINPGRKVSRKHQLEIRFRNNCVVLLREEIAFRFEFYFISRVSRFVVSAYILYAIVSKIVLPIQI